MKWLKKYGWLILSCAVPFIIYYGWRWLEVLMYGEPESRQVDDIVAFILSASVIFNIILLTTLSDVRKATRESGKVYREIYTSVYTKYGTAVSSLRTVSSNLKVTDMLLSETIKNESGEESKCITKYPDIQSFATHLKCMNDLNMNYIEEQLHTISNMNKEEKES